MLVNGNEREIGQDYYLQKELFHFGFSKKECDLSVVIHSKDVQY